ncbi:hypothetical protein [Caballeronia telluris]|uniref:Uncharacterized protein n=1 Tax=Caballeronia telluris TaxID=326475 RepID=A0A158G304_9BURK|nr:hypothetical protein [Caballeronia telluris]SAL26257.1 hypothetical protein AWB66_01523 [Caballeronia telluris]
MTGNKRAADDAEREAFDTWARGWWFVDDPDEPSAHEAAWEAWQAALSSRADGGKDSSDVLVWKPAYEAEHKRVQRLEAILLRELGYDKAREAIAAIAGEKK